MGAGDCQEQRPVHAHTCAAQYARGPALPYHSQARSLLIHASLQRVTHPEWSAACSSSLPPTYPPSLPFPSFPPFLLSRFPPSLSPERYMHELRAAWFAPPSVMSSRVSSCPLEVAHGYYEASAVGRGQASCRSGVVTVHAFECFRTARATSARGSSSTCAVPC